jgi:hypothetical protein
MRNLISSFW